METKPLELNLWLTKELNEFKNEVVKHEDLLNQYVYDEAFDCLGLIHLGAQYDGSNKKLLLVLFQVMDDTMNPTGMVFYHAWRKKQEDRSRKPISLQNLYDAFEKMRFWLVTDWKEGDVWVGRD